MAVNLTPSLAAGLGAAPTDKAHLRAWLEAIVAAINADLDPRAVPIYASRDAAVANAPSLPASLPHIAVREGTALVIRSRTAFADDPLFPTGARWGVVQRQDMAAETKARTDAIRDTGVLPLANVAGTANVITADLSLALAGVTLSALSTVELIVAADNTAAVTLNVGGVGAWPVQRRDGSAVQAGDLRAGVSYLLRRRASAWRLIGLLDSEVPKGQPITISAVALAGSVVRVTLPAGAIIRNDSVFQIHWPVGVVWPAAAGVGVVIELYDAAGVRLVIRSLIIPGEDNIPTAGCVLVVSRAHPTDQTLWLYLTTLVNPARLPAPVILQSREVAVVSGQVRVTLPDGVSLKADSTMEILWPAGIDWPAAPGVGVSLAVATSAGVTVATRTLTIPASEGVPTAGCVLVISRAHPTDPNQWLYRSLLVNAARLETAHARIAALEAGAVQVVVQTGPELPPRPAATFVRWLTRDDPAAVKGRYDEWVPTDLPGSPVAANAIDGGNTLGTTVSVTAEGTVWITNKQSPLNGDIGMTHYMVKVDNMRGKVLTVRRGTGSPNQDGGKLNIWQMAWAYDPHGEWYAFDSVAVSSGVLTAAKNSPLDRDTVYIARRPVFTNSRWNAAIARWRASPHTSPTASGDAHFVVGVLPVNAYAPAMNVYGFKIGAGPRTIFLSGNVHVCEHIAAYSYEALVDWLLGDSADAAWLRANCTIYCYPKLNPQARYAGASRIEVTTSQNANRIWADAGFDDIPLSKVMRDAWAVDLPATIDAVLDFHDYAAGLGGRGALYRTGDATANANDYVDCLKAEYSLSTGGAALVDETSTSNNQIGTYIRAKHSAPWALSIEHGTTNVDGVPQWQSWGRNVGQALRQLYAPTWIAPDWAPRFTEVTITDGPAGKAVSASISVDSGVSIQIPEGRTIELQIDVTGTKDTSAIILRQSEVASLVPAQSTALDTKTGNPTGYTKVVRVAWSAQRPYVGIVAARTGSAGANPSSFVLTDRTRYRVVD